MFLGSSIPFKPYCPKPIRIGRLFTMTTHNARHGNTVRSLLAIAGISAIAWMAWANHQDLTTAVKVISPSAFCVALATGGVFMGCQGFLFALLMEKLGIPASRGRLIAAYLVTQPGKYLPGKVWPAIMQTLYVGSGKEIARTTWANIELFVIMAIQMVALGAACMFHGTAAWPLPVIAGLLISFLVTISPSHRSLGALYRKAASRVQDVEGREEASSSHVTVSLLTNVGLLSLNLAASLLVIWATIPGQGIQDYMQIAAVFYFAFIASSLAIPVPAGIGVREAATITLGAVMLPDVPSGTLILVALVARFWQIMLDVGSFGIGLVLLRRAGWKE